LSGSRYLKPPALPEVTDRRAFGVSEMFPVADEEGDVVARIKTKIKELILKLARKNRSWGYPRIQGALTHLRPDASRGTIAKGLKVNELEPALTRGVG